MAAVNEDGQLNAARTAKVHDGVESGANGTARVQDVVHQHDALAVDAEGNVGGVDRGSEIGSVVIAVEADVEAAERNVDALDLLDLLGELLCQKVARVTMPTRARSSQPSLRSRISCAMRVIARLTAVSSMMTALGEVVPIDLLPHMS